METASGSWASGPAAARLILILSSERSGSTLLRVILGGHSRIIAPQELFILRYPSFETWRQRKPVAIESLIELLKLIGRPMTEAQIEQQCRGKSAADVYRWLYDPLPAQTYVLDKTPAYANDPNTLARSRELTPFYIWLIRHPLGVIDSHVRLKEKARRNKSLRERMLHPVRDAVERWTDGMTAIGRVREAKWTRQNANIRAFLRDVPSAQQTRVYFEDLVSAPDNVIAALCASIGIAAEPDMIRPDTRQVMNPHLGDPNFHLHGAIDAQPASGWRARYDESRLRPETMELVQQIGVRRGTQSDRSNAA